MRENLGWALIVIIMLCVIMFLHGCTQLGLKDRQQKEWNVVVEAPPEGGCYMAIDVRGDDEVTDDSIEFKNPAGGS